MGFSIPNPGGGGTPSIGVFANDAAANTAFPNAAIGSQYFNSTSSKYKVKTAITPAVWQDVDAVAGPRGAAGTDGTAGSSGGGALERVGSFEGATEIGEWLPLGIQWPTESQFIGYNFAFQSASDGSIHWIQGSTIYGVDGLSPVTDLTTLNTSNGIRLAEGPPAIPGDYYLGRSATDEVLLGNDSQSDFNVQFILYRYVTSAQQTGPAGGPGRDATDASSPVILLSDEVLVTTLSAATFQGASVISVADATGFVADRRVYIHGELHTVSSVNLLNNQITIEGQIVTAMAINGNVYQSALMGTGNGITLPDHNFNELDCRLIYSQPRFNGAQSFFTGASYGNYINAGGQGGQASWFRADLSNGAWRSGDFSDSRGHVIAINYLFFDDRAFYGLFYDPATRRVSFELITAGSQEFGVPISTQVLIFGR